MDVTSYFRTARTSLQLIFPSVRIISYVEGDMLCFGPMIIAFHEEKPNEADGNRIFFISRHEDAKIRFSYQDSSALGWTSAEPRVPDELSQRFDDVMRADRLCLTGDRFHVSGPRVSPISPSYSRGSINRCRAQISRSLLPRRATKAIREVE